MPVTRRKRANPPEQPENNNNNHLGEQAENTAGAVPTEQQAESPVTEDQQALPASSASPTAAPTEDNQYQQLFSAPLVPPVTTNGDHGIGVVRPDYSQTIEGGRRTARGELFRRPPQAPVTPPVQSMSPMTSPAPLQPPTHEIKLPLGERAGDASGDPLHLAYNPGYTGSEEVRSILLRKLAAETKHGGRARCWGCGSLAVAYECWNTRNKTFGEIGIAYCEICGVWSVM
jgi:hypothetical protein